MWTTILIVLAALLVAGLLLFRFNGLWIYATWDRATRNPVDRIPPGFDLPQYFRKKENGELDLERRWPGWDGWYFFVVPRDRTIPVKMLRGSLMTGLYGLDGIDNYERLKLRLNSFDAVEFLSLMPTVIQTPHGAEQRNNLSQHYLPRRWHLFMKPHALDVSITGKQAKQDEKFEEFGRISGKWPSYRFRFLNPEGSIAADLEFVAEKVVWWADVPGVFTYFSILGKFQGKVTLREGSAKPDPYHIPASEETYNIDGAGAFEHGFARRLFTANRLFLPVRLMNYIAPGFRPIRYHYETFLADNGAVRGGFMQARAFGVPVRDRGGFFLKGVYVPVNGVKITYFDDPPPDLAARHCTNREPVTLYRKWRVQAGTEHGDLDYTGVREFPPAPVAPNMTYYHFEYEGTYQGQVLKGRGYGEYVHI